MKGIKKKKKIRKESERSHRNDFLLKQLLDGRWGESEIGTLIPESLNFTQAINWPEDECHVKQCPLFSDPCGRVVDPSRVCSFVKATFSFFGLGFLEGGKKEKVGNWYYYPNIHACNNTLCYFPLYNHVQSTGSLDFTQQLVQDVFNVNSEIPTRLSPPFAVLHKHSSPNRDESTIITKYIPSKVCMYVLLI